MTYSNIGEEVRDCERGCSPASQLSSALITSPLSCELWCLITRTHTHALTIHNPAAAEPAGVHVRCTYTVWFVYLLCVSSTLYLISMVNFENMEYDDIYYRNNFTPYLWRVLYARFFHDDVKNWWCLRMVWKDTWFFHSFQDRYALRLRACAWNFVSISDDIKMLEFFRLALTHNHFNCESFFRGRYYDHKQTNNELFKFHSLLVCE